MTNTIREKDDSYTRLDELHEVEEWVPPRLSTADHLAVSDEELGQSEVIPTMQAAQQHFVGLNGFLFAMQVDPTRRRILASSGMQDPRDVMDAPMWQLIEAFLDQHGLSDATFVRSGRRYFVETHGRCAAGNACVFAFDNDRSTYALAKRAVQSFLTR